MTSSGDTLIEGVLVQPPTDSVGIRTTSSCLFIPRTVRILQGYAFAVRKKNSVNIFEMVDDLGRPVLDFITALVNELAVARDFVFVNCLHTY